MVKANYPPFDPIDGLIDWIEAEASVIPVREPDGYMTVYTEKTGAIFHGKVFDDVAISDRAIEIQRQYMNPQFRVRVYLK